MTTDPLMTVPFLIDYIKQINEEISLFVKIYINTQFDHDKADLRRITYENIQLITNQKKQFIQQLKQEFDYDFKDS